MEGPVKDSRDERIDQQMDDEPLSGIKPRAPLFEMLKTGGPIQLDLPTDDHKLKRDIQTQLLICMAERIRERLGIVHGPLGQKLAVLENINFFMFLTERMGHIFDQCFEYFLEFRNAVLPDEIERFGYAPEDISIMCHGLASINGERIFEALCFFIGREPEVYIDALAAEFHQPSPSVIAELRAIHDAVRVKATPLPLDQKAG